MKHVSVFAGNSDKTFKAGAKVISFNPATGRKTIRKTLYGYQRNIIRNWGTQCFTVIPTGAGKSLIIQTRAAQNLLKDISTIIIAPKIPIVENFGLKDDLQVDIGDGEVVTLPHDQVTLVIDTARSKFLERELKLILELESDYAPRVIVCCYESFRIACDRLYKKHKRLFNSKVTKRFEVVIDEAHHIQMDGDQNSLGRLSHWLADHDIRKSLFTATSGRTDSGALTAEHEKYSYHRRTLVEHHRGEINSKGKHITFCPDLNVHFRLFEHLLAYDRYNVKSDSELVVDSIDVFLNAYFNEYIINPDRFTLFIIPSIIRTPHGKTFSAADACIRLEKRLTAWRKNQGLSGSILNLGGFEKGKKSVLLSTDQIEYTDARKRLDETKKSHDIKIVISIKLMDEGVDWVDCEAVFIPRMSLSTLLMRQRFGRALRQKILGVVHTINQSNIYIFEPDLKLSNDGIPDALVRTACRFKCMFRGLEFNQLFSLNSRKIGERDSLEDRLLLIDQNVKFGIDQRIQQLAMNLHGTKSIKQILIAIRDEYANIGVVLTARDAMIIAVTADVIQRDNRSANDPATDFLKRIDSNSTDFDEFCNIPEVKALLEEMVSNGPSEFLEMLSDKHDLELDRLITEYQNEGENVALKMEQLRQMARNGEPRPSVRSSSKKIRQLAMAFNNYTRLDGTTYQIGFYEELCSINSDWEIKDTVAETMSKLRQMAKEGKPRPSSKSGNQEIRKLGMALVEYTKKHPGFYDELCSINHDWEIKDTVTENMNKLRQMAKEGKPKPSSSSKDPEIRKLASALTRCISRPVSGSLFYSELCELNPNWKGINDRVAGNMNILREMARNGEPRPSRTSKDSKTRKLASILKNYTTDYGDSFKPGFIEELCELNPEWEIKDTVAEKMNKLRQMAKEGKPKPSSSSKDPEIRKLCSILSYYSTRYPSFIKELCRLNKEWKKTNGAVILNMNKLRQMAKDGKPKPTNTTSKDPEISRLSALLGSYVNPNSGSYRPGFAEELHALNPTWNFKCLQEPHTTTTKTAHTAPTSPKSKKKKATPPSPTKRSFGR